MLAEITAELEAFAGLKPGWDGATALVVDATALCVATAMLRSIDRMAQQRHMSWIDPSAAPDPDTGGVDIIWQAKDGWLMLSVPPGEDYSIVVTSQRAGEEAALRRVTRTEAYEEAIALLEPLVMATARNK